jgi:DUF4097 and DUF4098 domain-containing protein YvlB
VEKSFAVTSGGTLVVDVEVGQIEVSTGTDAQATITVWRKVRRKDKAEEEAYLRKHPVSMTQEGDTVSVQAKGEPGRKWSSSGSQRTEARYTIRLPAKFDAQLKTAGGQISVRDLSGEVKANTSGGALKFEHLRGPLRGHTSGGTIDVVDCDGALKVDTSGAEINVTGGGGSFEGRTSGGSISAKDFRGPVRVETAGGGIKIANVNGKVEGSTSGGSISASFSSPPEEVNLSTTGGGVTLRAPEKSAFNLDAHTSGGSVHSDLPVVTQGKASKHEVKGPVNGGGKLVVLRTNGGSIQVKRL